MAALLQKIELKNSEGKAFGFDKTVLKQKCAVSERTQRLFIVLRSITPRLLTLSNRRTREASGVFPHRSPCAPRT